jgi:hypothetical protein
MRLLSWMLTGEGWFASLLRWATGEGKWVTITIALFLFDFLGTYLLLTFMPDWFFEVTPQTYLLIKYFGMELVFFVIVPIGALVFFIIARALWHKRITRISVYVLCVIKILGILWCVGVVLYAVSVYISESSAAPL